MIANELVTKFKFDVGSGFRKFDKSLKDAVKNTNKATKRMKLNFKNMGESVGKLKKNLKMRLRLIGANEAKKSIASLKAMAISLKGALKECCHWCRCCGYCCFGCCISQNFKSRIRNRTIIGGFIYSQGSRTSQKRYEKSANHGSIYTF